MQIMNRNNEASLKDHVDTFMFILNDFLSSDASKKLILMTYLLSIK